MVSDPKKVDADEIYTSKKYRSARNYNKQGSVSIYRFRFESKRLDITIARSFELIDSSCFGNAGKDYKAFPLKCLCNLSSIRPVVASEYENSFCSMSAIWREPRAWSDGKRLALLEVNRTQAWCVVECFHTKSRGNVDCNEKGRQGQ